MSMFQKLFFLCYFFSLIPYCHAQESLPPRIKIDFVLPEPAGRYAVARSLTSIKDPQNQQREIPVFLYFPVKGKTVPAFIIPTETWRNQYLPVLQKKLGDSAGSAIAFAKAHFATQTATISGKEKFPLILFAPGMGWSTLEYSYLIHEIVSAGYIVAAINPPALAPVLQLPGERFVVPEAPADRYQQAADDMLKVLQQVKDKNPVISKRNGTIDFKNVAVAGHSLGGAAAVLAAHLNPGIKAVVNMDGDMMDASLQATPKVPVLFLNQVPAGYEAMPFKQMQNDTTRGWRYQQMSKATSLAPNGIYLSIVGIYHSNFQDYALLPSTLITESIRKWRLGPIDGSEGLNLIKQALITYFDQVLKHQKTNLRQLEKQHNGIRVIDVKQ